VEPALREAATTGISRQRLVRLECRTEEFYTAMVREYKRNFELLLCGRIAAGEEHAGLFTRCPSAGEIAHDRAEHTIKQHGSQRLQARTTGSRDRARLDQHKQPYSLRLV